jgi:hypothetical protein
MMGLNLASVRQDVQMTLSHHFSERAKETFMRLIKENKDLDDGKVVKRWRGHRDVL